MPHIERTAKVRWEGNVARGAGSLDATSGAFTGAAVLAALAHRRPRRQDEPRGAARGGARRLHHDVACGRADEAGTPPGHLEATVTIHMDEVEGQGHQIVGSVVEFVVQADGVDDAALQAAVSEADEGCPFSALLKRAGATVDVSARLA